MRKGVSSPRSRSCVVRHQSNPAAEEKKASANVRREMEMAYVRCEYLCLQFGSVRIGSGGVRESGLGRVSE
jgi:hypothetical protein